MRSYCEGCILASLLDPLFLNRGGICFNKKSTLFLVSAKGILKDCLLWYPEQLLPLSGLLSWAYSNSIMENNAANEMVVERIKRKRLTLCLHWKNFTASLGILCTWASFTIPSSFRIASYVKYWGPSRHSLCIRWIIWSMNNHDRH